MDEARNIHLGRFSLARLAVWVGLLSFLALMLLGPLLVRAEDKYLIIHEPSAPTAPQPDLLAFGVKLRCGPGKAAARGSGVILHDGNVLTAAHCVQGTGPIVVDSDGHNAATVSKVDASMDLALLSVKWIKPRRGARIATDQISPRVEVFAVGRDRNGVLNLESHQTQMVSNGRLRLTPAFIVGSSGGGIFNQRRELIGIICENDVGEEPYIAQAADLVTIKRFLGLQSAADSNLLAVMYSTNSCGWCRANDNLIRTRHVLPFRYREVKGLETTTPEDPDGSREFPDYIRRHAKVYGWPVWHLERPDDTGMVISGYKTPEDIVRLRESPIPAK